MSDRPPLVDIHCHLLPGLDDGSADWDETLAMARLAADDGIAAIVVTPHQLGGNPQVGGAAILALTADAQRRLDEAGIALQLLPGAEVRIEPDLVEKLRRGQTLSLADRRRHVLLELPHDVYLPPERLLGQLRSIGAVGILAHPERNAGILSRPDLLRPLVDAGCLMQVTAGSLLGAFGSPVRRLSHWMLRQGLVHFVGSDAHGADSRRPLLGAAFDCVAELVGEASAVDLCCRNPAAVAAGRPVACVRPKPAGFRLGWFRWSKAG